MVQPLSGRELLEDPVLNMSHFQIQLIQLVTMRFLAVSPYNILHFLIQLEKLAPPALKIVQS